MYTGLTTENVYQAYYKKLCRFTEFLKLFIKEYEPKLSVPTQEMEKKRQVLITQFSTDKVTSTCAKCNGNCCHQGGSPLKASDLVYSLLKNPDFKLPEPDYNFLKVNTWQKTNNEHFRSFEDYGNKCVFLGKNGCRLKENRPKICLSFVCNTLKNVLGLEMNLFKTKDWYEEMEAKLRKILVEDEKRLSGGKIDFLAKFTKEEQKLFLETMNNLLSDYELWLVASLGYYKILTYDFSHPPVFLKLPE